MFADLHDRSHLPARSSTCSGDCIVLYLHTNIRATHRYRGLLVVCQPELLAREEVKCSGEARGCFRSEIITESSLCYLRTCVYDGATQREHATDVVLVHELKTLRR